MYPKKNKKPSKNGYWQFVLECRDNNPNRHINMQELQAYASKKWQSMSKEERSPYEEMAKLARAKYSSVQYTSEGLEIDEVERKEKEQMKRTQDMREDIVGRLKSAVISRTLQDQIMLIVHINHLVYYPAEDKYFICEIAVAAVSLRNGVEEVYHALVKPGKLPLGFYGPAFAHSKQTHKLIELALEEPYPDNTAEIARGVERFIEKYGTGLVYADEKTLEMTSKVFENWLLDQLIGKKIEVYNFQYLFPSLRNAAAGETVWPNESFSFAELEKDVYSYTPNLSCDYHEMSDLSVYCSKSIVTRCGYTLCEHCCPDLGIQLRPGSHVPVDSGIANESKTCSKSTYTKDEDDLRLINRCDSLSLTTYDDNFPALGDTQSNASSWSSVASKKWKTQSSKNDNAKRNFSNSRFPRN